MLRKLGKVSCFSYYLIDFRGVSNTTKSGHMDIFSPAYPSYIVIIIWKYAVQTMTVDFGVGHV